MANGYVALGPFRSEFYLIPGSDIFEFGNLPWHENLAVHEYRHVQQYNNFNNGLAKVFRVLGGQQGQALANALTVPDWFFEGDAVYAETALTQLGRGRQPLFLSAYNSLWQAGKDYSWLKLRNGSYKDYVPNHYPLGYLLVNYGYLQHGNDFWQKVSTDASAFKGLFYPFQKAIKRHAGVDFKQFRKEALLFYRQEVETEETAGRKDKTVTNYYFPQSIGDDSLLYLKESYRQIPAFYVKDNRGEHRIQLRHISSEEWLSYRNGILAYTAYDAASRWSLIDFSDIILLNIHTQKEKRLTRHGKYFTPDIAPDGKTVLAVFINDSLETELHVLNSNSGQVLKKIRSRDGAYFIHPRYVDAETIVVGIRQPNGDMTLNLMNLVTGAAQQLIAPTPHTMGFPFVQKDTIYFTASFNANDDIYAYQLKDRKVFQLTSGQTGHYYPAVYKDSLVWSKFTAQGRQLQQKALSSLLWTEVNALQLQEQTVMYPVADADENVLASQTRSFEVDKYRKITGLFNLHSWNPGLSLYSNNILNTMATELYYRYNESERSHTTGISASYGGWYPVINTGVEYTYDRHIKTPQRTVTANEMEARIGYSIPLNFTKGKTYKYLNGGSNLVYNRTMPTGASKTLYNTYDFSYLHHFINWSQQLPKARQHIFPKLGYAVSASQRHRLGEKGYQFLTGAAVYLPSLATNHSVVFTGSFQQVDTGNAIFSNRFSLARGYPDYYYSRMWNVGANYHLPLLYPDWGFASIVYFMRIRGNVFFDYSQVYNKTKTRNAGLRSTGTEVFFDTKWWNQLPVTFGVRYSYLLDREFAPRSGRHIVEFVAPINLLPF